METLPTELKLKVLKNADFHSLKALVHASPTYHAIYLSSRLEILKLAILRHQVLSEDDDDFNQPIIGYAYTNNPENGRWLQFQTEHPEPNVVDRAFEVLLTEYQEKEDLSKVVLSVEELIALRSMHELSYCTMETLPAELKLKLLKYVDFPSLRALTNASPSYHAVYLTSRLSILTSATLRYSLEKNAKLNSRFAWGVNRTYEDAIDNYLDELWIQHPQWTSSIALLEEVINHYYDQADQHRLHYDNIQLSVEDCITLLTANHFLKPFAGIAGPNTSWKIEDILKLTADSVVPL